MFYIWLVYLRKGFLKYTNRSSKQLTFNHLDAQPTGISKISLHIIIRIKLIRGKK